MLKKFQIHTLFRIAFGMEGLITLGKDVLNRLEKSGVIYKLICKRCKVTYVGQTGRLLNTRVEEHKKNLGRKCNYYNVLSDHRKEYADHDFDWNNVEILHSESNKGKRRSTSTTMYFRRVLKKRENEHQRRQVLIARTNINANKTLATRNPLRRWALNDIEISKSEKKRNRE